LVIARVEKTSTSVNDTTNATEETKVSMNEEGESIADSTVAEDG
jgi:hypothetical protein